MFVFVFCKYSHNPFVNAVGPEWLNHLGSWITKRLIQAYHQYGVSSRPALQITKRVHSTRNRRW
jgi:hypothetical protein